MKTPAAILLTLSVFTLFPAPAAQGLGNGIDPAGKAPATLNQGPYRIEILRAIYGVPGAQGLDVTYALQGIVNNGVRSVPVSDGLGGDPAPGLLKELFVTYRVGNRRIAQRAPEGTVIDLR